MLPDVRQQRMGEEMSWIMFLFGMFVGGTLGTLLMAIAVAAKDIDEYERGFYRGYEKGANEK